MDMDEDIEAHLVVVVVSSKNVTHRQTDRQHNYIYRYLIFRKILSCSVFICSSLVGSFGRPVGPARLGGISLYLRKRQRGLEFFVVPMKWLRGYGKLTADRTEY